MEKKTVFLELPADIVDEIDRLNIMGDRSVFISDLLRKQLLNKEETIKGSYDFLSKIEDSSMSFSSEINIFNKSGINIGSYDINTVEGFEDLTKKISEITNDPHVRMRAKLML